MYGATFAQAAQVPRHLPRRLRKPRKFRGICRDVCASCASSAAFAETFAQAAQVPRHLPRRLRRSRKFRGIHRDVCASRASSTAFAETFAQAAQVPRHLPRRLRRLRWVPPHLLRRLRKFRKHPRLRQNVSPVATGIFFDPRGRRVIRKITTNYPIDPFINNK